MNLRLVLLLCLFSATDGQFVADLFNIFFRPLWNLLVQGTCNSIAGNFDDGFRLGCECRGIYQSGAALEGLGGSLKCQNDDKNICVIRGPVPLYCGNAELDVDFNARRGATKIVGKMNVLSGLPEGVSGGELPEITATIIPENGLDFTFKSCEIKFDKTKCTSCTVCDNKRDFKFNCSNINVNPTAGGIPVEGPALTECEGFGFLGDI